MKENFIASCLSHLISLRIKLTITGGVVIPVGRLFRDYSKEIQLDTPLLAAW